MVCGERLDDQREGHLHWLLAQTQSCRNLVAATKACDAAMVHVTQMHGNASFTCSGSFRDTGVKLQTKDSMPA